eukprot:CAMPEP_0183714392 /NCGR_PEP_ID=MMETSP0737-20130205/8914_1 /TAXON_ID=385413 /ORGANISM="Thalassiosira miniscula, Strain CCMP1093" /LENGTH=490 /DNA_ID=CAMNT_0025943307 /DNA_START=1 /DNA_END=1470 /DNA_ORIENTATION=+
MKRTQWPMATEEMNILKNENSDGSGSMDRSLDPNKNGDDPTTTATSSSVSTNRGATTTVESGSGRGGDNNYDEADEAAISLLIEEGRNASLNDNKEKEEAKQEGTEQDSELISVMAVPEEDYCDAPAPTDSTCTSERGATATTAAETETEADSELISVMAVPEENGAAGPHQNIVQSNVHALQDEELQQAYPVEDGGNNTQEEANAQVIVATPLEPWWKQKNTKVLLIAFLVVLAILSIVLGITFSSSGSANEEQESLALDSPEPTGGPTFSLVPTSSPTPCTEGIIARAQKIDSQMVHPKVAIDGNRMIIVGKDLEESEGLLNVMFRTDTESGSERTLNLDPEEYASNDYSVSITSQSAFVGLPDANDGVGEVMVYEERGVGVWEKIDSLILPNSNNSSAWGRFVDLDGDLACIGGNESISIFHRRHGDFHRPQDKWVHLKKFDIKLPETCIVADDTIAFQSQEDGLSLYRYQSRPSSVVLLQSQMPAN